MPNSCISSSLAFSSLASSSLASTSFAPSLLVANASVFSVFAVPTVVGRCYRSTAGVLFGLGLLGVGVVLAPAPAIAQEVNRATLTQILDGSDVFIQNRKAKVNDSASKGQRVRTGAARAELKFNTGAIGRMGHNSILTVGQCARLTRGRILINGAMNGCSGSAVAGVRGTTYLMEVDDAGQTRVTVLEGRVLVAPATSGEPGESDEAALSVEKEKGLKWPLRRSVPRSRPVTNSPTAPARQRCVGCASAPTSSAGKGSSGMDGAVQLSRGEAVVVTTAGKVGTVAKLSEREYRRILTGSLFDGYTVQIPGIDKVRGAYQQLFPGLPFPLPAINLRVPSPVRLPTPVQLLKKLPLKQLPVFRP